jgi:hypothetical protein
MSRRGEVQPLDEGSQTVRFAHVKDDLAQGRKPATTAHRYLYRWYSKTLSVSRRLSIVESIAACASPFAVEEMLRDVALQGVPERVQAKCRRVAAARLAELRGELYVEPA